MERAECGLKTDRFRDRENQLSEALKIKTMQSIWKQYLRQNLRDQAIFDLHDNYDFHIHIENKLSTIVSSVLEGIYQPQKPIRLRKEKKNGRC